MGRLPRVYVKEALYYIICSTDSDTNLFKDDEDRLAYLSLIWKYKREYEFKVYGFNLEPHIIYLLIEPSSSYNISQIMHSLNSNYTKYYNGRYQRKGHLFRGRFKAKIVEKNLYLSEIIRYLYYRPVTDRIVDEPQNFSWGSLKLFLKSGDKKDVLSREREDFLKYFSQDREEAGEEAKEFMNDKLQMEEFAQIIESHNVIGSDEFIDKVKAKRNKAARENEPSGAPSDSVLSLSLTPVVKVGLSLVAVLLLINLYLFISNAYLKKDVQSYLFLKEAELENKLAQEREEIREDLDEKYRADQVSYEAMLRRLEIEKDKVDRLRKKAGDL